MKIAPVAEVKAKLSSFLDECGESPVVVTRNGRAVAVLVAVHDDEELEGLILAHTPRLRALLEAAEKRVVEGQGIRHEELWASLEGDAKPDGSR